MAYPYESEPDKIIEGLLKHHSGAKLKAIINSRMRKKSRKGNNYFSVASEVYLVQHFNDSKLEWAKETVAERLNINVKTIGNHILKFRHELKKHLKELDIKKDDKPAIDEFIKKYKQELAATYRNWVANKGYESLTEDDYRNIYNMMF